MAIDTDRLVDQIMGTRITEGDDDPREPYEWQDKYWLASPYFSRDIAEEVAERFASHVDEWDQSSVGRLVWSAYRAYHNLSDNGVDPLAQLVETGEQGELLALAIPHYRSLVKHQIALFTKERPAWEPQARTADAESARQVSAAGNLLDYVASTGVVDRRQAEQAELMMVAGSGFLVIGWDANAGMDGTGWFTQQTFAPWEIAHEQTRVYDDCQWWIYRSLEPRWDWVAHYAESDPEKAEQIASTDARDQHARLFQIAEERAPYRDDVGDRIPVLTLVAKPTKACPEGRLCKVTGDAIVLLDGPHPYGDEVTISRMCASEFLGTSIPYCDSWGVLAAAEAYNAVISMILTRVDTCGVPNFFAPEGSELEYSDIARGNAFWKLPIGSEKPGVIDLLTIPPELVSLLPLLSQAMEQTVGINSVTRGQPSENVSSGSMAALLQGMALEFNSNLERAWTLNLERVGTHYLRVFQAMADEEQAISVMGSDNRWTVQTMKAEDVRAIRRISVKTASALSKTTAGRAEIADKLLERGGCTPQEYLRVIQTGQLDPTFFGPVSELTTIKARGERLLRGEQTPPLIWDNHQLAIRELRGLLNTEARNDPQLAQVINGAIQAHFELWSQLSRESPDMLAAIGIPPLPQALSIGQQAQAMQTPGAPPGPPAQHGPGPQQQPQPQTEPQASGSAPGPKGAEPTGSPKQPKEARPAKNPMNGQPVTEG